MIDFIAWGVLLILVGGAIAYIVKSKKSGVKCIGCPAAKTCANAKSCRESHDHCDSDIKTSQCSCGHDPSDK